MGKQLFIFTVLVVFFLKSKMVWAGGEENFDWQFCQKPQNVMSIKQDMGKIIDDRDPSLDAVLSYIYDRVPELKKPWINSLEAIFKTKIAVLDIEELKELNGILSEEIEKIILKEDIAFLQAVSSMWLVLNTEQKKALSILAPAMLYVSLLLNDKDDLAQKFSQLILKKNT